MGKDGQNSKRITITFPSDTYETLQQFADDWEISFAEVVRLAVGGNLERYLGSVRYLNDNQGRQALDNQKRLTKKVTDIFNEMQGIRLQIRRIGINYNQQVRALNTEKKIREEQAKLAKLPEAKRDAVQREIDKLRSDLWFNNQSKQFSKKEVEELLKQFDRSAAKAGDALCRIQG